MTPAEVQRYARQILIGDVGRAGQERWLASRVTSRGSGPALDGAVELLRAAGVAVTVEANPSRPPTPTLPRFTGEGEMREVLPSPATRGRERVGGPRALPTIELEGRLIGEAAFADRRAACPACLEAFFAAQPTPPVAEAFAVAFGVGALAAADVMLSLLDGCRPPRAMALVPQPHAVEPVRAGCACRS